MYTAFAAGRRELGAYTASAREVYGVADSLSTYVHHTIHSQDCAEARDQAKRVCFLEAN